MKTSTIFLLMILVLGLLFLVTWLKKDNGTEIKNAEISYYEGLLKLKDNGIELEDLRKIAFNYYRLKKMPSNSFEDTFLKETK